MLARANRVVRADDYRGAVRRGRKLGAAHTVAYVVRRDDDGPVRFGFIVAKTVGNAVIRNRVRRRLKAASFELVGEFRPGTDVVIRALPAAAEASWVSLRKEIFGVATRSEVDR